MHHATISRLLRGHSAVPSRAIHSTGRALGLSVANIMNFIAVEETEAVIAAIRRPAFRLILAGWPSQPAYPSTTSTSRSRRCSRTAVFVWFLRQNG